MTINGPAPTILAMFLNTAIDQHLDAFRAAEGREPTAEVRRDPRRTLATVRGTVQADILKEDQGQNTCIFSTEFALRMMADIQSGSSSTRSATSTRCRSAATTSPRPARTRSASWPSRSPTASPTSRPTSRAAWTSTTSRRTCFFFSNGMDPEYTVLGRVARRIWAIAMRDRYGADERSQKLKYHVQTSGRSLHAQEMDFNDIRTTLQALCAIYDNANSLHTNAYDEAVTTPTAESVRRALAIQLIINKRVGPGDEREPQPGQLHHRGAHRPGRGGRADRVRAIAERGGVLGAMETGYQRGKIQDESMLYEQRKHDGSLPIIGVNTFLTREGDLGADRGRAGPRSPRRRSSRS
jgi:isobutyryl-CoA mutase